MIDSSVRLRRAIFSNDLVLARRIIRNNPRCIRTPDPSDKGNTPLHLAASLGFIEIAMYLIEAGHEDEGISRNFERETPLMCAVGSIISTAPSSASTSSSNTSSNPPHASSGTSSNGTQLPPTSSNRVGAAHMVPSASSIEDMVRLLAARFPRCIPWTNRSGLDAFQLAAQRGSDRIVSLLLSTSSSPPARAELLTHANADGNTALHFASAWGNMKCISVLVGAGADPLRKNAGGYTPIDYSSTVSAEVYFRGMVMELEKKQRDAVAQAVVDNEIKTRRRGGSKPEVAGSDGSSSGSLQSLSAAMMKSATIGPPGMAERSVRLVDDREDAVSRARSPSLKELKGVANYAHPLPPPTAVPRDTGSGRATPIGWRENWALGLRGRSGSTE